MSQLKKLKRKVLLNLVNLYCDGTKWAKVNKQRFAISGLKPYKQGIQEWKQMWGGLLVKPNPLYYHLFGNYVHESKYIIPENVSHIVVEAILNPREYRFFYDDKNSFDSIFPEGFLPRTILQNIGGDFVHKNTPPIQ